MFKKKKKKEKKEGGKSDGQGRKLLRNCAIHMFIILKLTLQVGRMYPKHSLPLKPFLKKYVYSLMLICMNNGHTLKG